MNEMIKVSAEEIFAEIDQDDSFKEGLGLFETVRRNNNFYHDKQWEGVRAPDLDKPVFNVLKPAVNYFVSMLVSDDVGVDVELLEGVHGIEKAAVENAVRGSIDSLLENVKFNWLSREFLKNCAIDGDACFYLWWDEEADKSSEHWLKGAIQIDLVDNTDVCFGDKSTNVLERQPFVIIRQRKPTLLVREEARKLGIEEWEEIRPDGYGAERIYNDDKLEGEFTTLAVKFWKEDGKVWWTRCTREVMLNRPVCLGIERYPIVYMSWEREKNCCHGISPLSGRINNQIFINKIYAMAMEYQKNMAFPKLLYDATLIPKWSNKVGQAIAVNGNPQTALFATFAPNGMNEQALSLANSTISLTKDSMGVYDAALGNVKPNNTSAIIAVQQASAQPLELQRLDFYQAVEDLVRIELEFMGKFYGLREVLVLDEDGNEDFAWFDFGVLAGMNVRLKVNVGRSSYWSELVQVQTLDNMLAGGIIPDAYTYLEQIPEGYVRNKSRIMRALKKKMKENDKETQKLLAQLETGAEQKQ